VGGTAAGDFDQVFARERVPMVRLAYLMVGSQALAEESRGRRARDDVLPGLRGCPATAVAGGVVPAVPPGGSAGSPSVRSC